MLSRKSGAEPMLSLPLPLENERGGNLGSQAASGKELVIVMDTTPHRRLCYTLIGLEVLLVVMAIYGSVSMLLDAAGFGLKEAWLQGSPFTDYRIPALALLLGVGGTSCLAAIELFRAHVEAGGLLSVGAGFVLVLFELAEFHTIGPRNVQEPLMLAIGLLIAAIGGFLWNSERPRGTRGRRLTYAR